MSPNPQTVKFAYPANTNKPNFNHTLNTFRPSPHALLPAPTRPLINNTNIYPTYKPIRPIRTKEMDDRRAKGLCFWCDEKCVPRHRCRNKKLYSLCIIKDDEENLEEGEPIEIMNVEVLTPHLSLQAIQGTIWCQTIKVWGKIDKCYIFILIDSGSTHNFLNFDLANKLRCPLTPIKSMKLKAANGGAMLCAAVCKNPQ
jgi:hypothetical protein